LFATALAIFLLGCLHEDVAILAAGYLVVERGLSPWLAAVAFGGLLVNNFAVLPGMLPAIMRGCGVGC
jgi:hypothetical protein